MLLHIKIWVLTKTKSFGSSELVCTSTLVNTLKWIDVLNRWKIEHFQRKNTIRTLVTQFHGRKTTRIILDIFSSLFFHPHIQKHLQDIFPIDFSMENIIKFSVYPHIFMFRYIWWLCRSAHLKYVEMRDEIRVKNWK